MSDEKLTCTKMVEVDDGTDSHGKKRFFHEKCGAPAAEYEFSGILAAAKAVLCARHKADAIRENAISERGYKKTNRKPKSQTLGKWLSQSRPRQEIESDGFTREDARARVRK